jgi:hypothetical protein
MQVVDRAALLVTPKAPYVEWAKSIDDKALEDVAVLLGETSVYLVAEPPDDSGDACVMRKYATQIFEHELVAWHRDEEAWPRKRDYMTFMQWFDVRVQPLIFDLEDRLIETEPVG